MPASSAARTHAWACSSSTCEPCVIQLPYEISLTERPLRPSRRNSMCSNLATVRLANYLLSPHERWSWPGDSGRCEISRTGRFPVSRNVDRLAALVHPVSLTDFVATVGQWLRDAHEAAQELQPFRRQNPRGSWENNTSFGTDRYQYLLRTAASLVADLPDLEVETAYQSVLFKLPRVGVYPLSVPHGPDGPVEARDLRRQLVEQRQEWALFDRRYAVLGERQVVLMPWSGSAQDGLTGVW